MITFERLRSALILACTVLVVLMYPQWLRTQALQMERLGANCASLEPQIFAGLSKVKVERVFETDLELSGNDRAGHPWSVSLRFRRLSDCSAFSGDADGNGIKDLMFTSYTGANMPIAFFVSVLFEANGRPTFFSAGLNEPDADGIDERPPLTDSDGDGHLELLSFAGSLYEADSATWYRVRQQEISGVKTLGRSPTISDDGYGRDLSTDREIVTGFLHGFNFESSGSNLTLRIGDRQGTTTCRAAGIHQSFGMILDTPASRRIASIAAVRQLVSLLDQVEQSGITVKVLGGQSIRQCSPGILWASSGLAQD